MVANALKESDAKVAGQTLWWFTDAMNVIYIMRRGSMVPKLEELAQIIFFACKQYEIHIRVGWLPCEFNKEADAASRLLEHYDWRVADTWFIYITDREPSPDMDRFEDGHNHKTVETRAAASGMCAAAVAEANRPSVSPPLGTRLLERGQQPR